MRVGIIQAYKPIFTSKKKTERNQPVSRPDSFEKSEFDFDRECKILYSKLEKYMGVVTPQDIIKQANRVSKRTDVPLDDVYETMGLLSQYSSYKSLSTIENELNKHDIRTINNLGMYYKNNNYDTSICLTNVLHYISLKNFEFNYDYYTLQNNEKKALFIDSNLVDVIKKHPEFEKGKNTELFYIENFENGYNFLNQGQDFEDYTVNIIEKAKHLKNYSGKNFNDKVRYVLNSNVLENFNAVSGGGHINVIKQKNISTPEKIADNLNPIIPDYKTFKSTLSDIAKEHSGSKIKGEKYVIDFLNSMLEAVTPKKSSEYLQILHEKISEHLKNHHRDSDKVYYVLPGLNKSFSLINYQYQKANNIDNMQNYFLIKTLDENGDLFDTDSFPANSTFVILDDYLLSGQSMRHEQFPYEQLIKRNNSYRDKNMETIFAPIFATKNGIADFQEVIGELGRGGKDCIVAAKVLPEVDRNIMPVSLSHKFLTSTVMPYMGPDSNAEEFVPLYKKFFYSHKAQKSPVISFDFMVLEQ